MQPLQQLPGCHAAAAVTCDFAVAAVPWLRAQKVSFLHRSWKQQRHPRQPGADRFPHSPEVLLRAEQFRRPCAHSNRKQKHAFQGKAFQEWNGTGCFGGAFRYSKKKQLLPLFGPAKLGLTV